MISKVPKTAIEIIFTASEMHLETKRIENNKEDVQRSSLLSVERVRKVTPEN